LPALQGSFVCVLAGLKDLHPGRRRNHRIANATNTRRSAPLSTSALAIGLALSAVGMSLRR